VRTTFFPFSKTDLTQAQSVASPLSIAAQTALGLPLFTNFEKTPGVPGTQLPGDLLKRSAGVAESGPHFVAI